MKVSDILRSKGHEVATVAPTATVTEALARLADADVGALVVSTTGESPEGIVSERDIVRHLARSGAGVLDGPVSAIMTADVVTCSPDDTVGDLMARMTERRIRHLPVVTDGRLDGIISIGDVVKVRVRELEEERHHLESYITHPR